ncbi:hypothetical protein CupriaWKF_28310 [Cupriavidus sp. WKF15]|uniref:hypothetical protein n=1 Tax=Cupriavidus sp. WKF15 TaxID=3032282 RepID=UPI0023E2304C|nr:hypothetical protein [Cupriavidus sp. WKF15]WER48670.1 hypothetical protein CupriaWKF_28310 [Cupriavidus sp. WKF15]
MRLAALATLMLGLAACAPRTAVTSVRAQDYAQQPRRIYVIAASGVGWGPGFAPTFRAKFRDILRGCSATAAFEDVTGLELDRGPAIARAAAFQPDAVLTIVSGGGVVQVGGDRLSIEYNTTLADVTQNRAVWRAKFAFGRGSATIPLAERGAVFAIELTNKLKADGLLAGCSPIPLDRSGRLDASAIPKPRPDDITPARAVTPATISGKPTLKDLQDLLPTN